MKRVNHLLHFDGIEDGDVVWRVECVDHDPDKCVGQSWCDDGWGGTSAIVILLADGGWPTDPAFPLPIAFAPYAAASRGAWGTWDEDGPVIVYAGEDARDAGPSTRTALEDPDV